MNNPGTTQDRVRIKKVEVLSDNWYVLRKTTYDFQGRNGAWRTLTRKPTTAATVQPSCSTAS